MTFEEANNIVSVWGTHLEKLHPKLAALFLGSIPHSLLPVCAGDIERALNIAARHHHEMGDLDTSSFLQRCLGPLMLYSDDDAALRSAAIKYADTKIRKAICEALNNVH